MKKLTEEIEIKASREAVWETITDPNKYQQWASAFHEGSFFEGSWNQGEAIRFLIINKHGKKEGMVSEIAVHRKPEYLSLKHLGYVIDGIDDTGSEEIKTWAPSFENYTLIKLENGHTIFKVDMDILDDYYAMFTDLWPKALEKIKAIAELSS